MTYTVTCGVCRIDSPAGQSYLGTMSRGVRAADPDAAMRKMARMLRRLGLRPVGHASVEATELEAA